MKSLTTLLLFWLLAGSTSAQEFDLYVVDVGPNRGQPWQIIKYDQNGQNPELFTNAGLTRPQDILFLEDQGIALVSNLGSSRINRHDAETGELIDSFATNVAGATRIEIGPDGLLYALQWFGNGRVLRFQPDGTFLGEFTQVGVSNSIGLDWDDQGNLYVASFDTASVRRFDPDGNDLGLFIASNLLGPTNIWFDDNGDLLVFDWSGGSLKRFGPDGVFKSVFVSGLSEPEGVEFLDNGDFLVGNGGTSSVKRYTAGGTFVEDFVPAGLGTLAKPNALRIRPLGVQSTFEINLGLTGAWFNPDTPGQGMLMEIIPDRGEVFVAWFTYAAPAGKVGAPEHRWLTAQGSYQGDTATLTLFNTLGGAFDQPDPVTTESTGTATLTFTDCESAHFDYVLDEGLEGGFDMIPIAADLLCETLQESSGGD